MQLPEIERIRITSVVDNFVDLLLRDQGPVRRRPSQDKSYERCLCAEHGLAELIESQHRGKTLPLMFDFGASPLVCSCPDLVDTFLKLPKSILYPGLRSQQG